MRPRVNVGKEIADHPDLIPKGQAVLLSIAKFVEEINLCQTFPAGENFLGFDYICAA